MGRLGAMGRRIAKAKKKKKESHTEAYGNVDLAPNAKRQTPNAKATPKPRQRRVYGSRIP